MVRGLHSLQWFNCTFIAFFLDIFLLYFYSYEHHVFESQAQSPRTEKARQATMRAKPTVPVFMMMEVVMAVAVVFAAGRNLLRGHG